MKKITRHSAIVMYESLGAMALGHMNEDTLDVVMDNFNAFRKVDEDMKKLNEELQNRLYADVDKERKEEFFNLISEIEELRRKPITSKEDAQKTIDALKEKKAKIEAEYADIDKIYKKHNAVYVKLRNKEVDVDIAEVDANDFIKGVIRGKKDAPVHEIRAIFAPMFKAEEVKENDFSELDKVLSE
jgi:D-arabinose 1-dehydrogenase-like Zn-dependent alcohol dehydrogenase